MQQNFQLGIYKTRSDEDFNEKFVTKNNIDEIK